MVSEFTNVYLISETSVVGSEIEETIKPRLASGTAADTYLRNSLIAGFFGCEYVSNDINYIDEDCCPLLEAFC